ncbi:hypothetical protein V6N12_017454 [Hibiscus sabdariffa]|uniref:Uncharacterized protein n=1 Tax=Hibiscus sabdariffa TaxID=183260 RepID=A0ABR2CFJ0_9ROSI
MCKLSGHEHVQVEEHDNQVMVWRHNDLWKESNEDYKGMSTQEIRRGCVLPDEDVNVIKGVGCSLAVVAQGGEALGDVPWIEFNLVLKTVQSKRQRLRPRKNMVAKGLVNNPLLDSEVTLVREAHVILEVSKWVGVSTIGKRKTS